MKYKKLVVQDLGLSLLRLLLGASAVAFAMLVLGCARQEDQQTQIIFAGKTFHDPGKRAAFVVVSGTLTGAEVAYPNNSTIIACYSERKECITYSVEQIGRNQIGSLQLPVTYPVIKWDDDEIVAAGDADAIQCAKLTISIVRKSQTVLWVTEPINQSSPGCKNAPTQVMKWTIESSPAWKQMFK